MRVPYDWLKEWVDFTWAPQELGARLTMAGFELEGIEAAAPAFKGVVVAEIVSCERHPQADKLQVCQVNVGGKETRQIVCGAPNARAGLKSALAVVGAELPGELRIKAAKLRGVESQGMLCSAKELGLSDSSAGILELPADAPVGVPLRDYLKLDEAVLELNVTPNRGDAMSILGIAREASALAGVPVTGPRIEPVTATHAERLPVSLEAPSACPRFAGCIVRGIDNRRQSPPWMKERLRRAGVRSISPAVDVTNYVMLELGQPLHAYDLGKLEGGITVRQARSGEVFTLLDGREVRTEPDMLVIADGAGPVGLAGIMGGERTATAPGTIDVFLEGAFFTPAAVLGRGHRMGLVTDAGQRFERGVDPSGQVRAIERAVALLQSVAGGAAGPVTVAESPQHLPARLPVTLRASQLRRLLGVELPAAKVTQALKGLGLVVSEEGGQWRATPPAHRFDIAIEADLIEEVARIVGFAQIAEADALIPQQFHALPAASPPEAVLLESLAARGYQEAITLAFVDPQLQVKLFPDTAALPIANPISSDLSVMRVSLWPGLVRAALENQRRQQDRVRLFEHGARFEVHGSETREIDSIAGIALGRRLPEQWGLDKASGGSVDFYDVKADVMALVTATGAPQAFEFRAERHPALHPGRSARVLRGGSPVGWIGELHPQLTASVDFTYPPVLFELDLAGLAALRPHYAEISRYPQVRRDLAVVVDESVALSSLTERVTLSASSLLRELRVFDVYRGPGLEEGRKSVALGLIFQDISRTLTDDDVDRVMGAVVADLRETLKARIRE